MAERKFGWGKRSENVLIGKSIPRIDAAVKASGEAKYTADTNSKGTLFARLFSCKHAHAKLTALDLEAVKTMPGVKAVHAFKEVGDEIRWEGELIAAVAAERAEQAEDAVKALEATANLKFSSTSSTKATWPEPRSPTAPRAWVRPLKFRVTKTTARNVECRRPMCSKKR